MLKNHGSIWRPTKGQKIVWTRKIDGKFAEKHGQTNISRDNDDFIPTNCLFQQTDTVTTFSEDALFQYSDFNLQIKKLTMIKKTTCATNYVALITQSDSIITTL